MVLPMGTVVMLASLCVRRDTKDPRWNRPVGLGRDVRIALFPELGKAGREKRARVLLFQSSSWLAVVELFSIVFSLCDGDVMTLSRKTQ
ncbi:hypothetical protein AOLI_G00030160 [Acnodon oligacanthus]